MTATVEFRRRCLLLSVLFALCSCGDPSVKGDQRKPRPAADSQGATKLEALAAESGVIGEDISYGPVGAYGRRYEGGEDRLCIAAPAQADSLLPFAAEIRIGDKEYCKGRGMASPSGNRLTLRFAGGRCTIAARFESDHIIMPGVVDGGCAQLCNGRGSFAGVTFPRTGMDGVAARAVLARDGTQLCDR